MIYIPSGGVSPALRLRSVRLRDRLPAGHMDSGTSRTVNTFYVTFHLGDFPEPRATRRTSLSGTLG